MGKIDESNGNSPDPIHPTEFEITDGKTKRMFSKDSIFYGKTRNEKFRVTGSVGSGGFAVIYEAIGPKWNHFAMKTVKSHDEVEFSSIINEGRILEKIQCDNVLRLYYFHDGTFYDELPPYLILEYAQDTLLNMIYKRYVYGGQFSTHQLLNIFLQLSRAMQIISQEFVHHDINPANVLVVGSTLKIADFGVSAPINTPMNESRFTEYRRWDYVAPEFWTATNGTMEMDVYSMGLVFYEAATLSYAYHVSKAGDTKTAHKQAHVFQIPKNPCEVNRQLHPDLSRIIMKMITKDPQGRFHAWSEIFDDLGTIKGDT
jgi:eukaryotic-like serine/threonine-protein kinase